MGDGSLRSRRLLGGLLAVMVSGCVGGDPPKPVVQAPPAPDPALQPVDLTINRFNIRHGDKIGSFSCQIEADIPWITGAINAESREFRAMFSDAAQNAAIPVTYSPRTLFVEAAERRRTVYAVGASVASINAQVCRLDRGDSGTTTLAIDWEVQSIQEDKVVYRTRTTGINKTRELDSQKNAVGMFIIAAWRDAAAKLVAEPGFRQAIARKPEAPAVQAAIPVAAEKMTLPAMAGLSGPLSGNIDAVRRAAVTIDLGRGHGSGFFITSDGWVLTNAHVARGSQTVKVILADGRAVFGQVVRVHDGRDVALVKIDGASFPALPLRAAPVSLTEEVYAIGTPYDKKLSGTVTRGIVSQVRINRRNMTDIQADVAILPGSSGGPLVDGSGNVVGVSYAGVGELNAGVNFFIPIQDALAKLNVAVGGA